MKTKIVTTLTDDQLIMRSITLSDIEFLRNCKNQHKEYFFYKNEITVEAQRNWYNELTLKNDDHMFIIEGNNEQIGCIGIRLYQEFADVYNVILGNKSYLGRHVMTSAIEATVAFSNLIYPTIPVRVRVLRSNPAIKWYEKIGFKTIDYFEDHVLMQYYNEQISRTYIFNIEIELPKKNKI